MKKLLTILITIILTRGIIMSFTGNYDVTSPSDTAYMSSVGTRIREMKIQVQEVINIDHEFNSFSSSAGYHSKVTLIDRPAASSPAMVANTGILYVKKSSGCSELFFDTDDNDTLDEIQLTMQGAIRMPAGTIMMYAGDSLPTGWLWCDGEEYARTGFPDLFTAINTTYGSSTGSTFKVPNMKDRFPLGKGDTYALGASTGSMTHDHVKTVSGTISAIPAHKHMLPLLVDPAANNPFLAYDLLDNGDYHDSTGGAFLTTTGYSTALSRFRARTSEQAAVTPTFTSTLPARTETNTVLPVAYTTVNYIIKY